MGLPRKIYLELLYLEGCCRVAEIFSFKDNNRISGKAASRDEWFSVIIEIIGVDIPALIVFSHSKNENYGFATPKKFAEFLRNNKYGLVTSIKHEHITLYTARLNKKFYTDIQKYNKKTTKDAEHGDNYY